MSLTDQQRTETAADNCEVLRARLARYEDADGKPITTIAEQAREIERLNSDYNEACEDAMCVARELERQKMNCLNLLQQLEDLKAQPSGVFYTCIGKGGQYEYVGLSDGAGISKGEQLQVYRCTSTGRVFHRECSDFSARMERLNQQPASAGEQFKCDHAACVSLGEHHPFCEYVKQSSGGDERAAFEAGYAKSQGLTEKSYPLWFGRYGESYKSSAVQSAWWAWQARAALPVREAVADGWQLVPVEPTPEMEEAGCQAYMAADGAAWVMHKSSMGYSYKAMLAAAQSPSREGE